jgi:hypothetical protein
MWSDFFSYTCESQKAMSDQKKTTDVSGPLYTSLDSSVREIRLLNLHPGEFTNDLVCSFIRGSIGHLVPYQALSYVWGSQEYKSPVTLAGHDWHVTPSLAAALRHLRSQKEPLTLWIDQLCINQEDDEERNSQVGLMRDIYAGAKRVLVWLGESTPVSDTAFDVLTRLDPSKFEDETATIAYDLLQRREFREWTRAVITSIFFNPWWQRVWIIQEIAYAQDALVLCGARSTPWRTVSGIIKAIWSQCADIVEEIEGDMGRTEPKSFIWQRLDKVRRKIQEGHQGIKAWDLILWFRYCQSTRPEDRVYALLGLCLDIKESGFKVDYKRPHHDTFTLFTKHMIDAERSLRWLSFAGSEVVPAAQPSWCPCFDLPAGVIPDPLLAYMDLFNADGAAELSASISLTPPVLSVRGVQIDLLDQFCHGFQNILRECTKPPNNDAVGIWSLNRAQPRYEQLLQLALEKCLTADRGTVGEAGSITRYRPDGSFILQLKDAKQRAGDNKPLLAEAFKPWKHGMMVLVASTLMNRALFISKTGWVGLVPWWAKPGDLICILFGCKVPVILREQGDHYQYIGERLVKLCLAS